jgi:4-hydroxy-3-polyprenylbenzoate decarboxylase
MSGPLIIGISGASGIAYGIRLLTVLKELGVETHLILTRSAQVALATETSLKVSDIEQLATVAYSNQDIGAPPSSGSFLTRGMIVAPCSVKTLSEIASCPGDNLLSRAADVTLKERRRLVLLFRETPLHLGHIRSMLAATEAGAIVYPPVPAFYASPKSLEDMVDNTVGRVLDLFGIDAKLASRWTGTRSKGRP